MPALNPGHPLLLQRDGLNVALGRRIDQPWAWQHAEAVKGLSHGGRYGDKATVALCLAIMDTVTWLERQGGLGYADRADGGWRERWPEKPASEAIGLIIDAVAALQDYAGSPGHLDRSTIDTWLSAVAARIGWSRDRSEVVWGDQLQALRDDSC